MKSIKMNRALKKRNTYSRNNSFKGTEIICLAGKLWITQKHNRQDYILKPGDHFKSRVQGLIVVQAMEDSHFRVNEMKQVELSVSTPQLQTGMASA